MSEVSSKLDALADVVAPLLREGRVPADTEATVTSNPMTHQRPTIPPSFTPLVILISFTSLFSSI
jgi:hypothetical protein